MHRTIEQKQLQQQTNKHSCSTENSISKIKSCQFSWLLLFLLSQPPDEHRWAFTSWPKHAEQIIIHTNVQQTHIQSPPISISIVYARCRFGCCCCYFFILLYFYFCILKSMSSSLWIHWVVATGIMAWILSITINIFFSVVSLFSTFCYISSCVCDFFLGSIHFNKHTDSNCLYFPSGNCLSIPRFFLSYICSALSHLIHDYYVFM